MLQAYPYLFRLAHWLLSGSLVVLVLTGLSQHAAARPDWSLFSGVLPGWCWSGRMNLWHLTAAAVFLPFMLGALWARSPERPRTRCTHILLLGGGLAMIVSGLMLADLSGPAGVYTTARWVHAVVGLIVLPIGFIWHVVEGLTLYRDKLVPAFSLRVRPKWKPCLCFLPVVLVTTCMVLNGLPVHAPWHDLVARRIAGPVADDAEMATLPWKDARPLRIKVANGAGFGVGFNGGWTLVSLRALHDGRELFVLAEWLDPAEDRQYMPWKRTGGGWEHLVTDPNDESVYYEDKFSLVFPTVPDWQFERFGCAAYCHVGGGRAYGYKGSKRLVDVWHWKSTRTDPVGQVDDKYWSDVDFQAKDVGRHGDPKQGGGYEKNISKDKTAKTHPAYLPDVPQAAGQGIIPRKHAFKYSTVLAAEVPADTIIPGIVASAFEGDRGHLRCFSRYKNGRWLLLIRRKLDTGSPFDVKFIPGRSYPFGCAAFDRTSKRHAYGLATYRLVL